MNRHQVRPSEYIRRRTRGQKIRQWFDMPRLTRRDRNQRLAIAGIILVFGLYLLVRPLLNRYLDGPSSQGGASGMTKPKK